MTRIVEWQRPYTGWTAISIDRNKIISLLIRSENNLLGVNGDNELYCDLQMAVWITPSDTFPVWITVGRVLETDWWVKNWTLINAKTTSGDYCRWLYWVDNRLLFDGWAWTWKRIYFSSDVDQLLQSLRNSLATVAFTGDYNDLRNRPEIIQLQADWNQTDTDSPDYIKNKPTKLTDFENDLSYADNMVTAQEYEDLPETKLTDWKIYMLYS